MELKPYQRQVVNDVSDFMQFIDNYEDLSIAYKKFWSNKGFIVDHLAENAIEPYKNIVEGCPHVCVKVPTAGGKTFIACNALKAIFDKLPPTESKAVVWLVPSIVILDQTIKNLQNPDHPYRQKISSHFNGRVEIYDKDRLLQGAGFNPDTVKESLSIFVFSYDTFRSRKKENRKIYEENSSLANFPSTYKQKSKLVEGIDETSLMQVINQLNPVCIVDESHNAESDLSVEMLQNLNPRFILDLTATPRNNSNIISYVDSSQLKKENMVKLPVIVYNHHEKEDVITNSFQLRNNLEQAAKAEEAKTGKYIRPIILFQAQPKTSKDNETFEKIKEKLIKIGIPKEQIAIKTANINEIKNIDLLSKDCEIRYIITVNALKEGWDCPFAYILASLANKSSAVDVEQILGRVLRQPHVQKHSEDLLNISYVFTASSQFQETLKNIVTALNKSGFSRNDYRLASDTEKEELSDEKTAVKQALFGDDSKPEAESMDAMDLSDIDETRIVLPTESKNIEAVERIQEFARSQNNEFEKRIEAIEQDDDIFPDDIKEKMTTYSQKDTFKEEAKKIQLPNFFLKEKTLFDEELVLLHKQNLLDDFNLATANADISFESISPEIYQIDLAETKKDEFIPEYKKAKDTVKNYLLEHISHLPEDSQLKYLAEYVFKEIRNLNEIDDKSIKQYISRVIEQLDSEQIADLKENPFEYAKKIKIKVKQLAQKHAEEIFKKWLDTDKIVIKEDWAFPKHIHPTETISITKSLYESEGKVNDFEHKVIVDIANAESVLFWHRNGEKGKGFYINGFMNHYPDFIVQTKKGNVLIVETKGDYLGNDDSMHKLNLGRTWANKAGNKYKYFMVFKENPFKDEAGAYSLDKFLEILKDL